MTQNLTGVTLIAPLEPKSSATSKPIDDRSTDDTEIDPSVYAIKLAT